MPFAHPVLAVAFLAIAGSQIALGLLQLGSSPGPESQLLEREPSRSLSQS